MIKSQLFIAAALFVGVAIGFFASEQTASVVEASAEMSSVARRPIADHGETASVAALRRRVAELEALLAARGNEASEPVATNAEEHAASERPRQRGNWREGLENLKKEDPARYAEITNRIAQVRRMRAERARTRMDFLSSLDTSSLGEVAKKTHETLQNLLARREELEGALHREDVSDEERGRLVGELRETHAELRRLNAEERQNLFEATVRGLGFDGEDVKDVATAFQEIVEATDDGFRPPRP